MVNYSKHFRRQLLVMVAVFLGATLLVMGLVPPQEAQSKEKKSETAQSQQEEEGEKATPAENDEQKEQEEGEKTDTPAEGDKAREKKVLDKDPEGNEVAAGELLVTYKEGAFKKAKGEAPKKVSGKVEKDFPEIEVQHISVPEVKNEQSQEARQEALERKKKDLEQAPDVEAVDYNYVREGSMIPTDPEYAKQWAPPKINAPQAWDTTRGSTSVKVAIIDSGIDRNHPDLKGKVVGQWDFWDYDGDASDGVPGGGHGTLVAGIEGASINNRAGVVGTCPDCRLLAARVLNENNWGYDTDVIAAINWAASNGAKVINMSFGGFPPSSGLETAINNAWGKGIVVVAAAGNNGNKGTSSPEVYPAAYPNVIAVAATDYNDQRAIYEAELGGDYPYWSYDKDTDAWKWKYVKASVAGPWVDVAAPGKGILTTARSYYSQSCYCYPASVDTAWGTSMAAPHVSGLAGLLFSKSSVSNAQVRKAIESSAVDLGTAGKDPVFGHGRINAQAALSRT